MHSDGSSALVTLLLTFLCVLDGIHSVAMANIQPLGEELW